MMSDPVHFIAKLIGRHKKNCRKINSHSTFKLVLCTFVLDLAMSFRGLLFLLTNRFIKFLSPAIWYAYRESDTIYRVFAICYFEVVSKAVIGSGWVSSGHGCLPPDPNLTWTELSFNSSPRVNLNLPVAASRLNIRETRWREWRYRTNPRPLLIFEIDVVIN